MNPVTLDKPIRVNDLLLGEGFTFTSNFEDMDIQDGSADDEDDEGSIKLSSSRENIDLQDEDMYEYNPDQFEDVAKLMTNVDDAGLLKKRIFREGKGEPISKNVKARVTFHYKAYLEFEAGAYDSSYRRRKPTICKLKNGELIIGLDMAIASMRQAETAQFIIHSDLAYGKLGCRPLIPPDSPILYEVTLTSFVELPADYDEFNEAEENKTDFQSNYDRASKLCAEAGYLIKTQKKYKPAILNYNSALDQISSLIMQDEEQSEKYVSLLIRLYTNLAVSHNKLNHYKKVCINCQEVYKLCNTYHRNVDDKIYYNHAKALLGLGDCGRADDKLRQAARNVSYHKPNMEVMDLYKKIQEKRKEQLQATKKLAKAMFQTEERNISNDFKKLINDYCKQLINGNDGNTKIDLPDRLANREIAFIRETVKEYKLQIIEQGAPGAKKLFIIKADK